MTANVFTLCSGATAG